MTDKTITRIHYRSVPVEGSDFARVVAEYTEEFRADDGRYCHGYPADEGFCAGGSDSTGGETG